jgi:site-specific recombinase XerD
VAKRKRIETYGRRGRLVRVFAEVVSGRKLVRCQWNESPGAPLSTESWPYSAANVVTAKAYAEGVEQRLAAGAPAPLVDRTIRELADLHITAFAESWAPKTLAAFRHRWARFESFVGRNTSPRLVTEEALDEFRVAMRKAGVATNQRGETVKAVKQVFRWARKRKLIAENPIADYTVKLAKGERRAEVPEWSPLETARLLTQIERERSWRHAHGWRIAVALWIAAGQGPRQNAMRHLSFDDVNLSDETVRHPTAADVILPPRSVWWNPAFDKMGAERVQPLTRAAVRALRIARVWHHRRGEASAWVLAPAREATTARAEPWTYQAMNHALRALCLRADPPVAWVTGRAFHGFRKFAAGEVAQLTGSERAAADWIGDTDVKVVRRHYLKKRAEEQRSVANQLNASSNRNATATEPGNDEGRPDNRIAQVMTTQ